ncbi:MAG: hypothetical protein K2K24_02290, partial [Clostridia bacterium]|nr:hypothetical protein [Clostridia bacterium]
MKKKVIALVLLVALVSALLTGCSLFGTDTNRDYHQVLATVSYDTGNGVITNVVYKGEVMSYVNRYGATYMNQLGWSAEQIVEYFYNTLTRQKLLVLYAQAYLYNNKLVATDFDTKFASLDAWNKYKSENPIDAYRAFMTVDEFRYCVEQTNKQFDDAWQSYIEEEKKNNDKNSGANDEDKDTDNDDKKIDYLTARSKKAENESNEDNDYKENKDIKTDTDIVNYFADKYEITIDASNVANTYFFNYINTVIRKDIADKTTYDIERTALKNVRDNSLGEILDYDYFLLQQMHNYIVDKYTDHVGGTKEVVDNIDSNVSIRYSKQVEKDIKSYFTSDAYSSAVGGTTFTYAAPSQNNIQVKSILLSFTDSQKEAITNLTNMYPNNDDLIKAYRAAIATGRTSNEEEKEMLELFTKLGINVNVSNPDYDADKDELKDAYTDATIEDKEDAYANPAVDYLTVLYAMAEDIQTKVRNAMTAAENLSSRDQHLVKEYASQQAFNDWINLVNDDGGMFSSDYYGVTPEGEATSYVAEYTVLARALTSAGVGAMAIEGYENNSESYVDTVAYNGKTEILKAANGSYTIYKKPAESSVGEDEDMLSTDIYTMVTKNDAEISFIINEFGIHIVMVTALPLDNEKGTVNTQSVTDEEDDEEVTKTMYVKGLDYVYSYTVEFT